MSVFFGCLGLSHLDVGFHHFLQGGLVFFLQCLALHSADNIRNGCNPCRLPWCRPSCLICIYVYSRLRSSCVLCAILLYRHKVVHDVPLDKENDHPSTRMHWQNLRLDSWMEQDAYGFTSFAKVQLSNIYHHFGLAAHAAQNDGAILVPTSADHGRSQTCSNRTVCTRAAS